VFLDLPESGLYAVSVLAATGGGIRFTADACRKSVLCPEPAGTQEARWRQVFSGQFAGGRHFLTLNLGRGAAVQRIRVERKREASLDYIATLRRLGLDLGEERPISRAQAVEAMRFIRARRGLQELELCQDVIDREPTLVAVTGAGQPVVPPGPGGPGTGPGPGPGVDPIDPLTPPVIPPQDIASPTVP
jgi:hypothetical protein